MRHVAELLACLILAAGCSERPVHRQPPPARPAREETPLTEATQTQQAPQEAPTEPLEEEVLAADVGGLEFWEAAFADAPGQSEGSSEPQPSPAPQAHKGKPRLVVYDFESDFDGGALGAKVASVISGHAARSGRFEVFPELEREAILEKKPFRPHLETDPDAVASHAREAFGAAIAIWGRLKGSRDSPILELAALDLRGQKESFILRERYECPNLHYIPMAAERILAACAGLEYREGAPPRTVGIISGNLLANGGFDKGLSPWTIGDAPTRTGVAASGGRAVLELSQDVAESTGLSILSEYIPLEPQAHYECRLRVRSDGPNVIVWVKGYADFPGAGPDPRREVYRHQMHPLKKGSRSADGWCEAVSDPFRPKHPRYDVRWMRLKLYAYLRPGRVEFDDVVLRKVSVEGAEDEDEHMRKAFEGKGPTR